MKFNNSFHIVVNFCRSQTILKCNTFCVRVCAMVFGLISVLLLFLMFYLSTSETGNETTTRRTGSGFRFTDLKTPNDYSGCYFSDCSVVCANSNDLNGELNEQLESVNCTSIDRLHIERQNFINGTLTKNWLLTNFCMHELLIMNSGIEMIENEAFNTEIFTKTFILTLQKLQIQKLTAGILLGLSQLEYLTVISNIVEINRGFFQPVRASLNYLKLNLMTSSIQFDEIFGISNMTSLIHLDLSMNHFNKTITGIAFQYLPMLRYLNLSKSKITTISENAFEFIKDTLKFLDLSHNKLTNIIDLKDMLVHRTIYVYMRENQWACDCNLAPLVRTFSEYKDMFMDVPYCKSPHKYYGEIINSIEYDCTSEKNHSDHEPPRPTPKETSTIMASTDQTDIEYSSGESHSQEKTVLPPSPAKKPFFELSCAEPPDFENFLLRNELEAHPYLGRTYDKITIAPPFYEFNIELTGRNSVSITIENLTGDLSVLWYYNDPANFGIIKMDDFNKSFDCMIAQHEKTISIENLKSNYSYTFCLIPDGNLTITPFNCLPFHIPAYQNIKKGFGWLSSKDKDLTVAVVCVVLSVSMSFGGCVAFMIIRNNPDLLEGNKHVLVVKKSCDTKSVPLSTISGASFMTNRVSLIPLTSKEIGVDSDSAYETPVDLDFDETEYITDGNQHYQNELGSMEDCPPPLPAYSEHIYGQINNCPS